MSDVNDDSSLGRDKLSEISTDIRRMAGRFGGLSVPLRRAARKFNRWLAVSAAKSFVRGGWWRFLWFVDWVCALYFSLTPLFHCQSLPGGNICRTRQGTRACCSICGVICGGRRSRREAQQAS